jgi:hypothetical protein
MLNEVLAYLKNYFDIDKLFGDFVIENGKIRYADGRKVHLIEGQHFRVCGSVMNDGVYRYYEDTPIDFVQNEAFNGAIWRLAVPQDVLTLADDIEAYRAKYEAIDSPAMSPFSSESFGGYSYSKDTSNGSRGSWREAFGKQLSRYRKI